MNYDEFEEGQIIHISALLSGEAVTDIERSPIVDGQSVWKENNACYRLRVTVPFSRNLARRLWGYGSDLRVDAPQELRELMVRNLRMASKAYDEADAGGLGMFASDRSQVTMRYFDDWKSVRLTCPVCQWRGAAEPSALKPNDSMRYPVSTFHCPRCGKALLAVEQSATMDETLANLDKLSPNQRAQVLENHKWQSDFDASKLKESAQLPDLVFDSGPNKLAWDIEQDSEGQHWNVIRHGARVLWRQPAAWEGFGEFSRVVAIVRDRYGTAIRDLEPTDGAMMWLWGDAGWASAEIDNARRTLGWTRLP